MHFKITQKEDSTAHKNLLPPISSIFGQNVFDLKQMAKRLSKIDQEKIAFVMKVGGKIDSELATRIASAVKEWAVDLGVTHYCHWFQPQTGNTAEKHDAFLWFDKSGLPFEKFTGEDLLQSEPDASSFPSGGIRSTFEARGYTAWDPSSPMFIIEETKGKTLYIPSVFLSYTGDILDFKTPLLKSNDSLSKEATKTLHLLGENQTEFVIVNIGPEQEFFVVDKDLAMKRIDLKFSGRTIFGNKPPKGQELEDHYFGNIPSRVQEFLHDFEFEMYRLGVPIKTRHNEVAPGQFEIAPIYESSNLACDHNQLVMKYLKSVALKHNFVVLLHEKPFAGVNGSGKHVNWSLSDSSGRNLLEPGKTPKENLVFLTFLVAILAGVNDNADVLRASIANAGNDHRLGANEAPPAIISVYLGSMLDKILNSIENGDSEKINAEKMMMDLGVSHLQQVSQDTTDRNRTSPFAFTGNKFEFRAVGSSASINFPTCILNAAVTDSLAKINETISQQKKSQFISSNELISILKNYITQTKRIRFEGNGYSEEWRQEASKRGLTNCSNTPGALDFFKDKSKTQFLINTKIFTQEDIHARLIIQQEKYLKEILIEMNCALEMAHTQIVPACLKYQKLLFKNLKLAEELKINSCTKQLTQNYSEKLNRIYSCTEALQLQLHKFTSEGVDHYHLSESCRNVYEKLIPKLNELKLAVDGIEEVTPADLWPFPKYREMLYGVE